MTRSEASGPTVRLIRTDQNNTEFLTLVEYLDAELAIRDGEDHNFYAQFNKPTGLLGVVLAYRDGRAVGCGAFKEYSADTVEIKRMYVQPGNRGMRIGARILGELEGWAAELNFSECILETGFKQPEAISLYKRSGYTVTPNYGQYAGVENSLCMKKTIRYEPPE